MTLGEYLKASVAKQWEPGAFDCCFFAIEWARTWGCGDPGAEWRGRYTTDFGGLRFVHEGGGLVKLWARGLGSIGIGAVSEPVLGDVAVVYGVNRCADVEQVGAIYTGSKWAMCAPRGLLFGPAQPVKIWGPRG